MFIHIFNWRSAFNKDNVVKIFPNDIDKDNYITKSITIPAKSSDTKYSLELDWDAPTGYDKDFMNESTIVARGRIKAYSHDWDREANAGQILDFRAGEPHEIMALEDGTRIVNIVKKMGGHVGQTDL